MSFQMLETEGSGTVIKVIGVGGAGGNAVLHMIQRGVSGIEFICANTDAQALASTNAPVQIQLGGSGLGAGAKPEQGREAAEQARDQIRASLEGANMVFITAGMGGGTGTGAAPIIAQIAQEMGILTVAVVTKPFSHEGKRRMRVAEEGVEELSKHVHSLIVVLNEKLYELLPEDVTMEECFLEADSVLSNGCSGIANIINNPGVVNVDFEDIRSIMSVQGKALMGIATASGPDRARTAAEKAMACPLLEGVNVQKAGGILIHITGGSDLKANETREICEIIGQSSSDDTLVIWGYSVDKTMTNGEISVTVVITGSGYQKAVMPQLVYDADAQLMTGTDNVPVLTQPIAGMPPSYQNYDTPTVFRNPRDASKRVEALERSGVDHLDIPAFLRKQAD